MIAKGAAIQGISNGTTGARADSHWPEILAAVQDRNVPPAELVRLILMEMSLVCHELQTLSGHSSLEFKLKPLLAEVHALRTLVETTRHLTEVAVQTDTVNTDGPKFRYLMSEVIAVLKESASQAGCTDFLWGSIYRFFRENIDREAPEIRRKMEKVTALSEVADAAVWPKRVSNESATNSLGDTPAEPSTT
jgi:hypothetical protein